MMRWKTHCEITDLGPHLFSHSVLHHQTWNMLMIFMAYGHIWSVYGIRLEYFSGTWDIMRSYHPLTSLTWRAAGNSHLNGGSKSWESHPNGRFSGKPCLISRDIKDGYANLTQTLRSLRWCFLFYVEPSVEDIFFEIPRRSLGWQKQTTKIRWYEQITWVTTSNKLCSHVMFLVSTPVCHSLLVWVTCGLNVCNWRVFCCQGSQHFSTINHCGLMSFKYPLLPVDLIWVGKCHTKNPPQMAIFG